jgi:hypothetical protein
MTWETDVCKHTGFTRKLLNPRGYSAPDIVTHHNCHYNKLVGLSARHLLNNNPEPEWLQHTEHGTVFLNPARLKGLSQHEWMDELLLTMDKLANHGYVEFSDSVDYIRKFVGPKYRRLVQCYDKTHRNNHIKTRITSFVKADKYEMGIATTKPPRMIQFRDPGTNVEVNRFMEPIEELVLKGKGLGQNGLPDCSKGLNLDARAKLWAEKRRVMKDPVCLKADYSKFDAHLHTHIISATHRLYETMMGLPPGFMDFQLVNKATTGKITYTAVGTRMSGDRDTGGGNSIVNIAIIRTIERVSGIPIEFLCDGDDSLIWVERDQVDQFEEWLGIIPKFAGMKLEVERAYTLEEEEFCHSKLILNEDGNWKCFMDPLRTLHRAFWVVNKSGNRQCGSLFKGIVEANRHVSAGLPMVQPVMDHWNKMLQTSLSHVNSVWGEGDRWKQEQQKLEFKPELADYVDSDYMRHQVWLYWGHTPEFQRQIENAYINADLCDLKFANKAPSKSARTEKPSPINFVNNRAFPWLEGPVRG